jgi:epoxyqueuosine reductase
VDYHDLMQPRLEALAAFIRAETGGDATTRAYVDTGPILERAYAAAAGLGFIGKNTCLIHPRMGSWLFLGEVLTDAELAPTPQASRVDCGTCRRCIDACPTGALISPYILDARRCISYLTIELKGAIPRELRPLMGNRIYGCDVCQQVCPWQRFANPTREQSFRTDDENRTAPPLTGLVKMDEAAFSQRFAGSPIARIGRGRLLRNAAVALGNWGDERALKPLAKALRDADPLVRGHAAWATGHIGKRAAHKLLQDVLEKETDADVRQEIETTLKMEAEK